MNLNGVEYYYIRNGQNDIIGLIDGTGAQVVSYTYDSWGKLISIDGSLKDTVGVKNPYRYRGYRYDTETGLYYLNSRYYNPEWGRFINADALAGSTGDLLSHNVFAYCKNNVVNMSDPDGYMPRRTGIDYEEMNRLQYSWSTSSAHITQTTTHIKHPSYKASSSIGDTAIQSAKTNVPINAGEGAIGAINLHAVANFGELGKCDIPMAVAETNVFKRCCGGLIAFQGAYSIFCDMNSNHSNTAKVLDVGLDLLGVGIGIGLMACGGIVPVLVGIGVGIGIDVGKSLIDDYFG